MHNSRISFLRPHTAFGYIDIVSEEELAKTKEESRLVMVIGME
jgi:hypothetical protein